MLKIKLTNETTIAPNGETLYRIKAIEDIPIHNVEKGDKGGFVSSLKLSNGVLRISDNAWIFDNASVYGNAMVYGNAVVYGDARVHGDASVHGDAVVYDGASVFGDAEVYGNARVYGNASVSGNANVSGNAWVSGKVKVCSKDAIINIVLPSRYSITVTRKHVQIGCKLYKRTEVLKITEEQAKSEGFSSEEFNNYRMLIKAAMKMVKRKV